MIGQEYVGSFNEECEGPFPWLMKTLILSIIDYSCYFLSYGDGPNQTIPNQTKSQDYTCHAHSKKHEHPNMCSLLTQFIKWCPDSQVLLTLWNSQFQTSSLPPLLLTFYIFCKHLSLCSLGFLFLFYNNFDRLECRIQLTGLDFTYSILAKPIISPTISFFIINNNFFFNYFYNHNS